jgi:hypothetical protein
MLVNNNDDLPHITVKSHRFSLRTFEHAMLCFAGDHRRYPLFRSNFRVMKAVQ